MNKPKSFLDIEANDTGPNMSPNATYIQKISHTVNVARDTSVVRTVERALSKYDRVLAVYGASHLLSQEPAFRNGLGKPTYEQLFKEVEK